MTYALYYLNYENKSKDVFSKIYVRFSVAIRILLNLLLVKSNIEFVKEVVQSPNPRVILERSEGSCAEM